MATTTQAKFFEQLEVVAATYKYDLVINKSFANEGTFRFENPGSFTPVLEAGFSFQGDRLRLNGIDTGHHRSGDGWFGVPFNDLDIVMAAIVRTVKR